MLSSERRDFSCRSRIAQFHPLAVSPNDSPLMRSRSFTIHMLALLVAVPGCSRGPKLQGRLQAAGGAAVLQAECAGFIRMYEESEGKRYSWMSGDTNFPPVIASFSPQAVRIDRQGAVLLVEVRVTGGFIHHGLLVAPGPTPAGFQPRMSDWPVWQIGTGVWEYRE